VVRRYGLQLVVLVLAVISMAVVSPNFAGEAALFATMEGFALVGIVTLGLAVTMIAGELDMSVGSMVVLSAVIAVETSHLGLWPCILVSTVCGVVIGVVQGFLIGTLRINSLVFTVGTLILIRGAAWILSRNGPVVLDDFSISDPLLQRFGVLSPSSIIAVALFVLVGLFLGLVRFGREIYAIGGARAEALAAGVPVRRALVLAFAISGGCAALAGALAALKGGSASPDGFNDVLLKSIAAALIGGISLHGGRGTVVNVTLGVLVVSIVSAAMVARGSQSYVTELLNGVLLVVIIAVEYLAAWLGRRRDRRRKPHLETTSEPKVEVSV
jgi:ribose/xylose/arabinose/galactoside ABC-type transport system permease subunit